MDPSALEQRCNSLRLELKAWEKKFAAQHDGRKAGRDDIKADAVISQKYKDYNKSRLQLSGKADPQTPSKRRAGRKTTQDGDHTPKARPADAFISTPLKRKLDDICVATTPKSDTQFLSPQGPAMIGPTPQRNGIVLGLFDHLPVETPSKRRAVLGEVVPNILKTPSKHDGKAASETSVETRARGERTPQSTGKRYLLDRFVTPQKRKSGEIGTPTSALKEFSTPAFLRRDNVLAAVDEEDEPTPRPAPWKRRSLGRSLSSMIQNMKKQEEDRLDEEADIMREMEMEADGLSMPRKQAVPQVLVEDSQAPMPLGPDRGEESSEEEEEETQGRPRKAWKKKGLKRQTRRVIMRPAFVKPLPQPEVQQEQSDSEVEAVITETQLILEKAGSGEDFSGDDSDGSDYATDDSHTPKKRKIQPKNAPVVSKVQAKGKPSVLEPVKKAARKIKATANANYRRLNIKSKAGNGKGGKGRFGRRHRIFEGGPSWELPFREGLAASSRQHLRTSPKLPPPSLNTTTATTAPPPPPRKTANPSVTTSTVPQTPSQMAERELHDLLKQLHQTLQHHKYQQSTALLSRAKVALLHLNALIPTEDTPKKHLLLARETLELGALISIRLKDPVSFTRYFQQLQPFYSLAASTLPKDGSQQSKITGLYLVLLLSEGDYAGFHTLLERLEVGAAEEMSGGKGGKGLEDDVFVQYPIRLEQALMEGSYNRVWVETKGERVPCEEFGMFSEVLIGTIRNEIASCSEKAYPSIPVSDAKSLLFLDSEGAVVKFAQEAGWVVKDSRIYFPQQEEEYAQSKDILATSDKVIENTLGYARELEMIV
ncbi:hypothetical protein P154DRAFT_456475 [Amniculicola lignicola CBS 123094]|uniref:DNA replication regulator SLD2 n=1 Tax=Amniculicola lignicola CBS 123094 TaxID=1392246 RepID=A0A6A5WYL3_9PLEO|nr:hypothetical protein P154DRAFT_456475 [Amniculicola lignicola CBS 123094]